MCPTFPLSMSRILRPTMALLLALPFAAVPALAQSYVTDAALQPRPLAYQADALRPGLVPRDSLSAPELARRVSSLYTRQAELLQADADGDVARYNRLLDALVLDTQMMAERPGVLFEPRFRELYSTVLTEYERFYDRPALDRGEVFAFRDAAIGAIEPMFPFDTGAYQLEHVRLPEVAALSFTTEIPMDVNAKVERYLRFLLARPGHVERLRQRADTYFPMVERVLAEEGVPDELKYLAMVESALNPSAYSHAGAAGMWQFIRATGRAYGLRAESEMDERLDPEKATRAAARHLKDLHDRFGDWQLALAGYNCNPAVIARASRRFEQRTGDLATFWDIDGAIPRETRAYVPMFIATALVLSNPDAYGLPAAETGPQYAFDRVPVAGGTRLSTVARTIGVDEAVIRALNPSLRQGRVPNARVPHMLRIPVGMYAAHEAALDRLAPPEASGPRFAAESVQFRGRAVRPLAPLAPSDALIAASQAAGQRAPLVAQSRPAAPLVARDEGRIARQALVANDAAARPPLLSPSSAPALALSAPAAARETAADAVAAPVAQAETAPEPMEALPATPELVAEAMPEEPAPAETHSEGMPAAAEVAELDLGELGTATNPGPASTEPELVAEAAPVETEPAAELVAEAAPVVQEAPAPQTPKPTAAPLPSAATGLVAPGLLDLARAMGPPTPEEAPTAAEAAEAAEAAPEAATPVRTVSSRPTSYVVQRGEYLYMLANRFGTTVTELKRLNGIGDVVHPGQRLTLPGGAAAPEAAAPATARTVQHRVRSGDTLSGIAVQYGVTVRQIQRWNNMSGTSLLAGQRLRIETTRGARTVRG